MPVIQYSDGTKIDFSGTPTQQDAENAYRQAKGLAPVSTPAAAPVEQPRQVRLGDAQQVWQGFKAATIEPVLHPIENIVKPLTKLAGSAVLAPVDAFRAIVMGLDPIRQEGNMTTIQSDFAENVKNIEAGTMSPIEATGTALLDIAAGAGVALGGEAIAPTVKAAASATRRGITKAVTAGAEKVGGKTAAEILATPEAEITKLTADQQKLWYSEQARAAKDTAIQATERAKIASETAVTEAKTEINRFQQELGDVTREKAISLKQPAQQLMKDTSAKYVELTGEAVENSPALTKAMTTDELAAAIDSKFEYNPEIGASLKADLGIERGVAKATGELPVIEMATGEAAELTNQQILDMAREIMTKVSRTAKTGSRVYTPAEYEAIQKYSFLMEQLGKNGVDMAEANALWRQWAPVRDRIVREIRPFDEGNIGKIPLASTLQKAEATVKTGAQATAKLDAQNFIAEIESRLKLPKGSVTAGTKQAISKVEQAKLAKVKADKLAKDVLARIKADKAEALKTMSLKKYDTLRTARTRRIVKTILVSLGIWGAARVTGLDRTLMGVAAAII